MIEQGSTSQVTPSNPPVKATSTVSSQRPQGQW